MFKNKLAYKLILVLFLVAQFQFITLLDIPLIKVPGTQLQLNPRFLSFVNPLMSDSAGLSSASATLSNPRLSFSGQSQGGVLTNGQVVTLKTGALPDVNTGNLFPNDALSIGGNPNLQVASISSQTVFTIKTPLPVVVADGATIYATQSGKLTVDFYTSAGLPLNGKIVVQIPANASNSNDGGPDSAATTNANGFDFNNLGTANITCPTSSFVASVTPNSGTGYHTVTCTLNGPGAASILAGAHFTVVIGDNTKGLINPAPVTSGHVQGAADIYTITTYTRDSSDNNIESVPMRAAPIEGVLVTATIDETLSFTVAGDAATSGSRCGITRDTNSPATTATAVPWNTINSDYMGNITKHNTDQQLTITTNAPTGYTVYAEENDQMGKDGNACTGAAPSVEPYTYTGGGLCVRDFDYTGASYTNGVDWTANPTSPTQIYGFGYSLQNQSGTDAQFQYNDTAAAFKAKHFADQENTQNKYAANAQLMSNVGPVSGSSVYVCYRIHVPALQPAGYYYNKLKFTAVPKF